ncbi:hypothetical protein PPYR_15213, partial [Photinus pyralis]
ILWREKPSDPLTEFQLNTVTYGISSASYWAIRSLFQIALENVNAYPAASKGSNSLTDLTNICKEIIINS